MWAIRVDYGTWFLKNKMEGNGQIIYISKEFPKYDQSLFVIFSVYTLHQILMRPEVYLYFLALFFF